MKLSDFGISRSLDNTVGLSNTAVGTSKYMSPERLFGMPYNESADIYALGKHRVVWCVVCGGYVWVLIILMIN